MAPFLAWHSILETLSPWVYWTGMAVAVALVPTIVFSRKISQAKIAWLLGVLGFPWIGAFLYLTIGRRDLHRKALRFRGAHSARAARRAAQRRFFTRKRNPASEEIVKRTARMGAFPPIVGNRFQLLTEGPAAFAEGKTAMEAARQHIHLITYIFKRDRTGTNVLGLLENAARRGVEVRVLYDGVGTFATGSRFFDPVRKAGGQVSAFLPVTPFTSGLRVNLRNHRKLLIVDGQVAFLGGMNIGDEYASSDHHWRDIHARIDGPVVQQLQEVFAEDWTFATGRELDPERHFPLPAQAGDVPIQVVASGPDQIEPQAQELMFGALSSARESVDIITPYLVPPESIEQALRSAAYGGRRVRILLPEFIDHKLVRWAGDSYIPMLLRAGVQVWRHPYMSHGKVVIVDGAWATVGSTNLDMRSLKLNFELNVAIPHSATVAAMVHHFEREIRHSRQLTAADLDVPFRTQVLRSVANLLSPIL